MKNMLKLVFIFLLFSISVHSNETGYTFTMKREVPHTSVKNQSATSACWAFSGLSLFESELLRMGKKAYDLSEMYIVRETYKKKAVEYARRNGGCTFAGGGEYSDLLNVTKDVGLVPDEIYPGLPNGEEKHNHDEMDAVLKGYMEGLMKSPNITKAWFTGFNGVLDAYLGKVEPEFQYEGRNYTSKSFMGELGINIDDYIIFSSFGSRPYYKKSILDVPNHWSDTEYYNVPLDELMQIIDNALMGGYSVAWASKMNKGFSMKYGVAIVPEKKWKDMSDEETEKVFTNPHAEKVITQSLREKEFDHTGITGDHGMHIIGLAVDQAGNTFYKVKNSWGETGKYNGYIYASRSFVMLNTTSCMINKNAIPASIAQKMGIIQDRPLTMNQSTISESKSAPEVTQSVVSGN